MSIADKILELRQIREGIRSAIADKGGTLPEGSSMLDYAQAILHLPTEIDSSTVDIVINPIEPINPPDPVDPPIDEDILLLTHVQIAPIVLYFVTENIMTSHSSDLIADINGVGVENIDYFTFNGVEFNGEISIEGTAVNIKPNAGETVAEANARLRTELVAAGVDVTLDAEAYADLILVDNNHVLKFYKRADS